MGKITRALQKATQESIQHIEKIVKIKEYEKMIAKAITQDDQQRSITTTPYNDFDRLSYV